jgi:hypothetical protein
MGAWEIRGQEDGSAVLVHEGVEIGTIEPKPGHTQPQRLAGTYGVPDEEGRFVMFERREYVARGRCVEAVEGTPFLTTTLLYSSIASGGAQMEEVGVPETMSYAEMIAWHEAHRGPGRMVRLAAVEGGVMDAEAIKAIPILRAMIGCHWGVLVSAPDDTEECFDQATRRIALHPDPESEEFVMVQVCPLHASKIMDETTPHKEEP